MRPPGALHLGHYNGVLENWLKLQHEYQCLFFVADWHALTTHYDSPEVIENNVWDMLIDWLAGCPVPACNKFHMLRFVACNGSINTYNHHVHYVQHKNHVDN